jgi:hypothetical protein
VQLIDYEDPPHLAFITGPFTDEVGQCIGPMNVQSRDFSGSALAVGADLTVNLTTDAADDQGAGGTDGAGAFYTDSDCTTESSTTEIGNGNEDSDDFYYRATARGDGSHELTAGAAGYTPDATQTQTIDKATTTLTYTGDRIVLVGSTFHFKAVLSSDFEGCIEGKRIFPWRIIPNPITGSGFLDAPAPHSLTNASGLATKDVSTAGWLEGIYDSRVNFPGDDDCEASKDDWATSVLAPGNAATGGGFLAGYKVGGGRANFGFNVRPIVGSDPIAYKGQFLLIKQDGGVPLFRCKGNLDTYGKIPNESPDQYAASGKCDYQVWNAALDGGNGGWEVLNGYANQTFTIYFIDNGSGKGKTAPPPDEFGFTIGAVGTTDPSFAIAPINGGNIDVKSGDTTTSTGGTTKPGGGKK